VGAVHQGPLQLALDLRAREDLLHQFIGHLRAARGVEVGDDPAAVGMTPVKPRRPPLLHTVGPGVNPTRPVGQMHAHGRDHQDAVNDGGIAVHHHPIGPESDERCVHQEEAVEPLATAEGRKRNQKGGEKRHQHQHPDGVERRVDLLARVRDTRETPHQKPKYIPHDDCSP